MAPRPVHISSKAGIKRDGTIFEGDYYVDGQWCRFQRGLPRKMGGYRQISNGFSGASRGMYTYPFNGLLYTTSGSASYFEQIAIDPQGISSVLQDRTPVSDFTATPNNLWSIDAIFDTVTSNTAILAHPAPNLNDIASATNTPVLIGDITSTAKLIKLPNAPSVSGGVLVMHPYTVVYGNNGYVSWSNPGDPSDWTPTVGGSAEAYVTAQKIVAGINTRGGASNSPSSLLWSLDSLLRMSYIGGDPVFSFDTISDESSILSSQSIVEYDGIYFWAGTDRFLSYNGVVREVQNSLNLNWFYDNLNFSQRQKVFAVKIPRWGEIWWCFPFGDATECTHAVIYNIREDCWYDTILPTEGRSNGQFARVFQYPLMMGATSINAIRTVYNLTGGIGYVNGTYYNVPVINQTNTSSRDAFFDITVSGGAVTSVVVSNGGSNFAVDNVLTVNNTYLGGSGAGFQILVSALTGYSLWQHEIGTDELAGSTINPIDSYFETSDISLPAAEQSQNRSMRVTIVEPDFVQSGEMTCTITGRANARSKEIASMEMSFPDSPTSPPEQVVFFKEIRREMRFKFRSNTVGGNYQMGMCLAHIEAADGTMLGAIE